MGRYFWNFFWFCFFCGVLYASAFCAVGVYGYYYVTRDLPTFDSVDDYRPAAVSRVYAADGTLVGEFFKERRYPVQLSEVPVMVRNAFLAAEDASFYKHPGIDPMSIARALLKNLQKGSASQGGSTITQQVVKNLLLTREKKIVRKIKEAILSYRIEEKLSKDQIFEIYLNQIFLGNNAYGIKSAALQYFRKSLDQLTLAEASMLAGLPKAPSDYSPIYNLRKAKDRQHYVLRQMTKAGFISEAQALAAEAETLHPQVADQQNLYDAPYYLSQVREEFAQRWRELDIDTDGLEIHTALDRTADQLGTIALQRGLRAVDKRRGWRGPIAHIDGASHQEFLKQYRSDISATLKPFTIYPAMVTEIQRAASSVRIDLGELTGVISLRDTSWANHRRTRTDEVFNSDVLSTLKVGDVIEVVAKEGDEKTTLAILEDLEHLPSVDPTKDLVLDQTPDIQGALVLLDPNSGKVVTLLGGFSYQRSVFNRATQALRQPGSSFKPIIYLSAIDSAGYTASTIVNDTPRTFRVGDELWTPGNYDGKFLGQITLQVALEKSRNLVSAEIVSKIGVSTVRKYAALLGIESKIGKNLSISLGSSEVTPLELTRAYGVMPAKGVLFPSVFITKILDRHGNVIYDYETEKLGRAQQVVRQESAFILSNMMKGVVQSGTATAIKPINRPVGGKTGTSNNFMDVWFVGFTPHWACGIWVGFDQKKAIGAKETGGRIAAPIWLNFMQPFLNLEDRKNYAQLEAEAKAEAERLGIEYVAPQPIQPLDFSVPDGVDPIWINKQSGQPVSPDTPGAVLEYFVPGTEPSQRAQQEEVSTYLDSPEL